MNSDFVSYSWLNDRLEPVRCFQNNTLRNRNSQEIINMKVTYVLTYNLIVDCTPDDLIST